MVSNLIQNIWFISAPKICDPLIVLYELEIFLPIDLQQDQNIASDCLLNIP